MTINRVTEEMVAEATNLTNTAARLLGLQGSVELVATSRARIFEHVLDNLIATQPSNTQETTTDAPVSE